MTDDTGALVARYDYDPWGRMSLLNGTALPDFGYAGYYLHAPTGLNLAVFRAYDPELGQWLSRDPIGERGGIRLHGYVGGDPINFSDPSGESAVITVGSGFSWLPLVDGPFLIGDGLYIGAVGAAAAVDLYILMSKRKGDKGENELTREAKRWAQETGGDVCDYLEELERQVGWDQGSGECTKKEARARNALINTAKKLLKCKPSTGGR